MRHEKSHRWWPANLESRDAAVGHPSYSLRQLWMLRSSQSTLTTPGDLDAAVQAVGRSLNALHVRLELEIPSCLGVRCVAGGDPLLKATPFWHPEPKPRALRTAGGKPWGAQYRSSTRGTSTTGLHGEAMCHVRRDVIHEGLGVVTGNAQLDHVVWCQWQALFFCSKLGTNVLLTKFVVCSLGTRAVSL